jgi:hypothetical protein
VLSIVTVKALTGADQAVCAGPARYHGYTVMETGGVSAATVRIYDHASAASGTLIGAVNLIAGGSADVALTVGTQCLNGIYVDVGGAGTVAGSVRVG